MRELDALLEAFLDEGIADGEFDAFERLLELPDPEIYDCLSGRAAAREPRLRALIGRLRRDPAPFAANGAVE
jgi:succinate dehydrogenase flavin-adding protein (antitoxin of CptAB toxin-antitoxin module)